MHRFISFLLLVGTVSACVRSLPSPSSPTASTQPQPISNSPSSWILSPGSEPLPYTSAITALVTFQSDSGTLQDTVTAQATFALTLTKISGSASFTAKIETFTTRTGNRIASPSQRADLPIQFTGRFDGHSLSLSSAVRQEKSISIDCTDPAFAAVSLVQHALLFLPTQLVKDMTWQDSLSANGCSGPIPIISSINRSYRVVDEVEYHGRSALLLEKSERSISSGEGSQDQHRISTGS